MLKSEPFKLVQEIKSSTKVVDLSGIAHLTGLCFY